MVTQCKESKKNSLFTIHQHGIYPDLRVSSLDINFTMQFEKWNFSNCIVVFDFGFIYTGIDLLLLYSSLIHLKFPRGCFVFRFLFSFNCLLILEIHFKLAFNP